MLLIPTSSYIILQPLLRILTKSPTSALQSILHVLFLPTPFKTAPKSKSKTTDERSPIIEDTIPEEILKPGALYRECAIVRLHVPAPPEPPTNDNEEKVEKGKQRDEIPIPIADDGELGGELCGRLVWESYEESLKEWEKANPPPPPEALKKEEQGGRAGTPPDIDFPSPTVAASS